MEIEKYYCEKKRELKQQLELEKKLHKILNKKKNSSDVGLDGFDADQVIADVNYFNEVEEVKESTKSLCLNNNEENFGFFGKNETVLDEKLSLRKEQKCEIEEEFYEVYEYSRVKKYKNVMAVISEEIFEEVGVGEDDITETIAPGDDHCLVEVNFEEKIGEKKIPDFHFTRIDDEKIILLEAKETSKMNCQEKILEKVDVDSSLKKAEEDYDVNEMNVFIKKNFSFNLKMLIHKTYRLENNKETRKQDLQKYLLFNPWKEEWKFNFENKTWTILVYDPGKRGICCFAI